MPEAMLGVALVVLVSMLSGTVFTVVHSEEISTYKHLMQLKAECEESIPRDQYCKLVHTAVVAEEE